MKIRSRDAHASEFCCTARSKTSRQNKAGRWSAERRIHPMAAPHIQALPLAFRRSTAALAAPDASSVGSTPDPRFLRPGRTGRYPAKPVTVYRAPRGPVVVPVGRGPRAARERFARPRAGTALAPPSGSHPDCALRRASYRPCISAATIVKYCLLIGD
jgi:hypothetical protein